MAWRARSAAWMIRHRRTLETAMIAVQGPKSREILSQVIWTAPTQPSVAELGWFRFAVGRIGDYRGAPLVVSRTGYTGEDGFEFFSGQLARLHTG